MLCTSELITWEMDVIKPVHQEAGVSGLHANACGEESYPERLGMRWLMSPNEMSWGNFTKYSPL